MDKTLDTFRCEAICRQPGKTGADIPPRRIGRGHNFQAVQGSGGTIHRHEIGKGAANIDTDDQSHARSPLQPETV